MTVSTKQGRCPECYGTGRGSSGASRSQKCDNCKGTGKKPRPKKNKSAKPADDDAS